MLKANGDCSREDRGYNASDMKTTREVPVLTKKTMSYPDILLLYENVRLSPLAAGQLSYPCWKLFDCQKLEKDKCPMLNFAEEKHCALTHSLTLTHSFTHSLTERSSTCSSPQSISHHSFIHTHSIYSPTHSLSLLTQPTHSFIHSYIYIYWITESDRNPELPKFLRMSLPFLK